MFGVLENIWHGIESIPYWIVGGIVEVINLLILAIASIVAAALWLLPSMPTKPEIPEDGVVAVMNWLFPVEAFVVEALALVVLLILYFVVRWLLQMAQMA